MFKKILLLIFTLLLATKVFAYDIDIEADNLEYSQNSNKISASNNVTIFWEGKTVKADHVDFLFEEKIMNAYGNVKIEEDGNVFFAKDITYLYDEEKGELNETAAYANSVFTHAHRMQRLDKENFSINRVTISNCDLDEPHTYFKSRKAKLRAGKRITLYNALLFVGKVPIFWLPIFTKSLEGGKSYGGFEITIEPGYTSRGGVSLKTSVAYPFTDSLKATVFLDYLGNYGNGYGGEIDYFTDKTKASIYAYNIHDDINGTQRWMLKPYMWSRINDKWTLQSQAEFASDATFNNDYNDSNWSRVSNNPHSYVSLTRNGNSSNLNLLIDKYDYFNNRSQEFETQSLTLPKISYTLYPKKTVFGLTRNFRVSFANTYTHSKDFYEDSADFEYLLSKDFKFGRKFTLKPSVGIGGQWDDKDNLGNVDQTVFLNYIGLLNSRLRVTRWMDWNLNYTVKILSEKNSLEVDTANNNYGLLSHYLAYTNYMYIGDRTTLRNTIGYDLREYRRNEPQSKWSPLASELIYTPKHYITVYLRETQKVDPNEFQGMQLDITIGELESTYFNLGTFYQASRPDDIDNTLGIGFWFNPKWRFDYNIRTTLKKDGSEIRLNEHEFKVYRDLHCYNLGLTWKLKNNNYNEYDSSIYFKFDMKTNMPFSRTAS